MDTAPVPREEPLEPPLEPPPYGPLPVGSSRRAWGRRPADEAEAKAMASSLRLQIMRLTLHEPRTNKEIATALGRNPASVLHHVRTLVDTGFLIEQPVRRGERGSREVPYLASGKSWYLDHGAQAAQAALGDDKRRNLLLQTFIAEADRVGHDRLHTTRLGFRLTTEDRDELFGRIHELLDEIAARPSDPDGEPWGLFLALHPEG
jgi:DNA-binding transcriptional ArsR family regulator